MLSKFQIPYLQHLHIFAHLSLYLFINFLLLIPTYIFHEKNFLPVLQPRPCKIFGKTLFFILYFQHPVYQIF